MSAEYELVLMLDPEAPDERRDEIASTARERIESSGSLKAEKAWGLRKLAYEIRQRNEADYRFFRFETESPVLDDLDHNLKITDGVLRFRIFKVDPDSPVIEPPPPAPLSSGAPRPGGRRPGRRDDYDDVPAAVPEPASARQPLRPRRPRRRRRRSPRPRHRSPRSQPPPRRSRPRRSPRPSRPPTSRPRNKRPPSSRPRNSRPRTSSPAASAFFAPRGERTRRSRCLD